MNLIEQPWIQVRRQDGTLSRIAPWQVLEHLETNPVVALNTGRPDFDGSLFQFLVGLFQTLNLCPTRKDFERLWAKPPRPEELKAKLSALAPYFELLGEGPRFMQDFDLPQKAEDYEIAALLPDTPGENASKKNTDHFIKRREAYALCLPCTAAALFNLQTNAPAGGPGYRTGLRGGGPLNTLVSLQPQEGQSPSLWLDLCLNLLPQEAFGKPSPYEGPEGQKEWFPWTSPTRTSSQSEEVTGQNGHPLLMFWATPRRIWLDSKDTRSGHCSLCNEPGETLLQKYRTLKHGANYTRFWRHPFSPHYLDKKSGDYLCEHPNPGGLGYRHWLNLTYGKPDHSKRPADVVYEALHNRKSLEVRLWAFGYDFDNMKLRGWQETKMPLYSCGWRDPDSFTKQISDWLEGAGLAIFFLRSKLKEAQFGEGASPKGPHGFIDKDFWDATEPDFYRLLAQAQALPDYDANRLFEMTQDWHKILVKQAQTFFALWAEAGPPEQLNFKRIYQAKNSLDFSLSGEKSKLKVALGLATATKEKKK